MCKAVISSIIENHVTDNIDWFSIRNLYYYQPGGTSTKNLIHWLQIIESPKIKHFDYGTNKNLEVYGTLEAPEYDISKLENFKIKMFLTTSSGDPYCNREDFQNMIKIFKSANITVKDVGNYNHLDYLWGKNAHKDIYEDLLKFLED